MSMIIKSAVKSYDGKKNVINNLNMTFGDTGLYGIIGRSGTGKSTLINALSGLDSFTSGQLLLDDVDMTARSARLRDHVSVVYQEFHLMPELNVYQNIEIAIRLSGGTSDESDIMSLMEKLGIGELANRKVVALSGGEKQRVAIARAYLSGKSVIVADEPTGNLDYENGKYVFNMLREISNEKLVIVVSHDTELVTEYIENVYELYNGVLHKFGSEEVVVISHDVVTSSLVVENTEDKIVSKSTVTAKRSGGIGVGYYIKLAWEFLTKKKIALVCMIMISCISLSLFTMSFAILNVDVLDQIMLGYKNDDLKFSFGSGDFSDVDEDILLEYEDDLAIGIHNDFMLRNLSYSSFGDEHTFVYTLYELPDTDMGLEIVDGAMPTDCSEFIISINMLNNILENGNIINGVVQYEQGFYEPIYLSSVEEVLGTEFYLVDKMVTLVGVYDDYPGEEWLQASIDKVFFGDGMHDYLEEAAPVEYASVRLASLDTQFDGDEDSFGYNLATTGMEEFEDELIDIGGQTSRMPTNNDEVILECPVLQDGTQLYFHEIGDYVSLENEGSEDRKYKVVGYYTGNDYCENLEYNYSEIPITNGINMGAYITDEALLDYSSISKTSYNNIAFSTELDKELYIELFDSGVDLLIKNGAISIDISAIVETYLPLTIILGIAIVLLLIVCVICSSILLKGNFKSMAIMSGLGAKAHHTAIIASIMLTMLSLVIVAFGVPIAFVLNVIYNVYLDIGMAIGIVEVLVSIGALMAAYLVAVGISTVILRRMKVVDSLRTQ